jgi:glycerol-3-phosphate acyltransferase PlsX
MRIAIDAMGGDFATAVTVPASINALAHNRDIRQIILFGDQSVINARLNPLLAKPIYQSLADKIAIQHTQHSVQMSDRPAEVLRRQLDTSMQLALNAVVNDQADACVSAGNTGALIGLARHSIGLLSGVKRLAICAQLPTLRSNTYLLDIGANVDCSAEQLHQFAIMGSALSASMHGILNEPRVRALSIGAEAGKGNIAVNKAVALCESDSSIHFEGLIEGNALLNGDCEVIFCDGFVGNIALKSCEGTASYIRSSFEESIAGNDQGVKGLEPMLKTIDPEQFNGACLLGLDHLVFKSHGASTVKGFSAAIDKAANAVTGGLIKKLSAAM